MIRLQNITLQRGPQTLLEDTSLTIHPGRRIGVIGRNGCGKSSLFRVLLRELPLDGGELTIPGQWRIAHMAQEVSATNRSSLDYVLDGDGDLRRIQRQLSEAEQQGRDHELGHLYAELEAIHGFDASYRAEQLLHGLGFDQTEVNAPVSSFSGGWRIRLNLAQALMSRSDLLLLDEPTNHLDLDATLWLEQWLKEYPGTLLLISHDRDFLDNVADEIVHMEHRQMFSYRGNYSQFEQQRALRLAEQQAVFEKQQRRVKEIHSFVTRFKAKASKAKQAQSRVKELERMEMIAPAHVDSPFHFIFREADKTSNVLVSLADAEIGYQASGNASEDTDTSTILDGVNVLLQPGSRIGLLGPNGAGKSTLIKTLVGDLPLLSGDMTKGQHLKIGYFAQHQLEALDLQASALLHIQRLSAKATEQEIRNFLGGFNFHGDKALEPVAPFSGGEKARLALALVVWQKPNLLLLDEPTNHLDLEMRHALTVALQTYQGALVVISHDRHLLRNTVDEYWLVSDGKVQTYDGTLDDYYQWLRRGAPVESDEAETQKNSTEASPTPRLDKKAQRQQAAAARAQIRPLRNKVQKLETAVETGQQKLAEVDAQLADPALYESDDKTPLQDLLTRQGQLQKELEANEEQWLHLLDELEQLEQGRQTG